ncbi:MAG: GNAT family N-acetyltransferase [Solirubrobacterales bacterium]
MDRAREIESWDRGVATLLASWEANARGSKDAAVLRLGGVAAAVFPVEPERGIYNNAVLERGLDSDARSETVAAMEAAYESAGIDSFAAWVHEDDEAMGVELASRGYTVAETTRAMAHDLDSLPAANPGIEVEEASWGEYLKHLQSFGLPRELLAGVDPGAYRVLAARLDGEIVAAVLAFDHGGDCGLFNLTTYERFRRRGLGTALTVRLLADARDRGCATASLQSTPMTEDLYVRAGFRDLGRILEYVPPER